LANVIYITNTNVEFLAGERKRDAVRVDAFEKINIEEGAMINGVIIDDASIKTALQSLKSKYQLDACTLILDSNKIITKQMAIPKLRHKQILEYLQGELSGLYDGEDTLIYDYAYLGENEEVKGSSRILGMAIEKGFLESYLQLFEEMEIAIEFIDISVDVLIKLKEYIPGLIDASYAIMSVDGNNITSSVFANGNYVMTTRNRLFSDPEDADAFSGDITRAVSQLQQFASSSQNNAPFSNIYFTGITRAQGEKIFERITNLMDLEAKLLPTPRAVYAVNNEVIGLNHYLYTLGYLIGA